MGPLRVAFDMDGTLADFRGAYAEIEERLFAAPVALEQKPAPETREQEQNEDAATPAAAGEPTRPPASKRRSVSADEHETVWRAIESTPDFWMTLKPLEPGVVSRLHELTLAHNWEVFFITQRPRTAGRTVQLQTQHWLIEHGFPTPSVIPIAGGRGRAAAALRLDYLVDDTPQNCVDVLADSYARAILLVDSDDAIAESSARRLGIGTAHTVLEVLDLLVQATEARTNPSLFEKLRKLVGWR
jgi:hypothetical protein